MIESQAPMEMCCDHVFGHNLTFNWIHKLNNAVDDVFLNAFNRLSLCIH